VRVPLRVVAPSEVTAKDPLVVTAPINGVIAEVVTRPGQEVREGDLLFRYDKRVALEELNVARQQVQIIQSNLNRSSTQAFWDAKARAEISLLELKLEQERAKLRVAEYNVSKLEVVAEAPGRVVLDDPNEWRGKPVSVGQKVMVLVDPLRTKLRIWLPPDDNVAFDSTALLVTNLNAFPERSIESRLAFVADNVSVNSDGMPAVMAEADWNGTPEGLKLGLQGSTTLYGRQVSLAYWILRKPIGMVRKTLGI